MDKEYEIEKKKGKKKIAVGCGMWLLAIIVFLSYAIYWGFFDMNRLQKGDFLTEETSPNGDYTLKAYVTNGGAITSYAVRGELVFNKKGGKTKNIYWNYREDKAEISWSDDDTVHINGHELNVPNEKFDFRRD